MRGLSGVGALGSLGAVILGRQEGSSSGRCEGVSEGSLQWLGVLVLYLSNSITEGRFSALLSAFRAISANVKELASVKPSTMLLTSFNKSQSSQPRSPVTLGSSKYSETLSC